MREKARDQQPDKLFGSFALVPSQFQEDEANLEDLNRQFQEDEENLEDLKCLKKNQIQELCCPLAPLAPLSPLAQALLDQEVAVYGRRS